MAKSYTREKKKRMLDLDGTSIKGRRRGEEDGDRDECAGDGACPNGSRWARSYQNF